jgi:hypothetical protein
MKTTVLLVVFMVFNFLLLGPSFRNALLSTVLVLLFQSSLSPPLN